MEQILMIAAVGTLCIACFLIGARTGQKVIKGEAVTLPGIPKEILHPIQNIQENVRVRREQEEAEAEMNKLEVIIENLERYDGTSKGQKDIPG